MSPPAPPHTHRFLHNPCNSIPLPLQNCLPYWEKGGLSYPHPSWLLSLLDSALSSTLAWLGQLYAHMRVGSVIHTLIIHTQVGSLPYTWTSSLSHTWVLSLTHTSLRSWTIGCRPWGPFSFRELWRNLGSGMKRLFLLWAVQPLRVGLDHGSKQPKGSQKS